VQTIIDELKTNPDSRRIILSAWNPAAIEEMALPPCHVMSQFRVINGELSCQMYQRSADFGLGVPFNVASYALLTHILAQITGLGVGEFIWTGGDCHIYKNHFEQVLEQVKRKPAKLPELQMPKFTSLDEVLQTSPSQYKLVGYNPAEQIKMQMAV
jgi:thymidylate synthase